ncbi:MAG: hypothetical protein COA96_17305 [SAR86 cluster bacterium]|uniref:Uncharacterized protein n=1 Tax=SAR86 cluster bacterium TaxID=2030880 RepID=A0A2A5AF44_9GAMM|nr:MAG: hypothetical protein COA96_17305 [SAR86 cluster bacterium]
MQSEVANYGLFWLAYLSAAAVFYLVLWKATDLLASRWLPYLIRAVAGAVILTPWYTNSNDSLMAPALMIVILDGITIGSEAATRSIVPLILAIVFAILLATAILIFVKIKNRINK